MGSDEVLCMIKKMKALLKLRLGYIQMRRAYVMKAGWKSTEFWISIAAALGTFYAAAGAFISPELAVKVSAIIAGVYALARAITKATATTKDDEFLEKLAEVLKK